MSHSTPATKQADSSTKPSATSSPNKLARTAAISSLAVMGSRVLGLVREQIFAYFFGASREYDAFLTAFRIPNLLRDLLAEGALSAAFVTVFSKALVTSGKDRAYEVANTVINCLGLVLLCIVSLGIFFAPHLVGGMALGFDPEKAALTTLLTRTMFPYIFFAAMSACCMGMLNAQGRFGLPQSASTFFNLTSIVSGLCLAFIFSPQYMADLWHAKSTPSPSAGTLAQFFGSSSWAVPATRAMMGMAVGTLLGGLVQWFIQVPSLWRLGWRWQPRIKMQDPLARDVLRLMGPAVLGAGAVQLSVFVNSNFASTLGDRPISWLSYSFRLMQFPIGVFGVAVMTATLPVLSRQAGAKDLAGFGATLTQGLELVLCLTVPAAIGLAVLGEPILRLIFEHGRFGPSDTWACAQALRAYAVGLPAYSALKVVQPAFVAQNDARTPMWVSLVGVAFSIGLNWFFLNIWGLGHVGLALSTSMMALGSTTSLLIIMETRRRTLVRERLFGEAWRIGVAAAAMGLILNLGLLALNGVGFNTHAWAAGLELAVLIPLGMAVYFGVGLVLRIQTLGRVKALALKRVGRRK